MFLHNFRLILNKSSHRLLLEYYLEKYINESLNKKRNNLIIDFGSGNPRYKKFAPLSKWKFFDQKPSTSKVEFANEEYIPVKNVDLFLCIEVLQYMKIKQIKKLLKEVDRIVKDKGKTIISIPYLYPCDHAEYIRLRRPELYLINHKKIIVKSQEFGNIASIIHDIFYQFTLNQQNNFLKNILLLILIPLKYFSLILDKAKILKIKSGFIFLIASKNS